jgi:putative oxidoreductase
MAQSGKGKNISLWILQILLAAAMLAAGILKLNGQPEMVLAFDKIGWGRWFLYVTGVLEVVGGIGLLIPRLVFYAALLIAAITGAAIIFCITSLGQSPLPAALFLAIACIIAYMRKP